MKPQTSRRLTTLALAAFIILAHSPGFYAADNTTPPNLLSAEIYDKSIDLSHYWISEKLDGVRAYWDGRRLISRRGNVYLAPSWFTQDFPTVALDGELWMGRKSFDTLSGTVRRQQPIEENWRKIRYWVFDLPHSAEVFDRRLQQLRLIVGQADSPYLQMVDQFRISDHQALMDKLAEVTVLGGEGLMLHRGGSLYRSGRSDDLLKLKPYQDAEARVVGHLPGKGKYQGMLGALLVETEQGKRFRIGTGFSDAERRDPPPIGSILTYQYHGLTPQGLPRFSSFLRIREEY